MNFHLLDGTASTKRRKIVSTFVKRGAEYLRRLGLLLTAMAKTRRREGLDWPNETRLGKGVTRLIAGGIPESDKVEPWQWRIAPCIFLCQRALTTYWSSSELRSTLALMTIGIETGRIYPLLSRIVYICILVFLSFYKNWIIIIKVEKFT